MHFRVGAYHYSSVTGLANFMKLMADAARKGILEHRPGMAQGATISWKNRFRCSTTLKYASFTSPESC
jgi:hypothetical protein